MTAVAYDYEAAATATGIGKRSIEAAVAKGELTAHYLGRKPIIRAADLDDWISSLPTEKP